MSTDSSAFSAAVTASLQAIPMDAQITVLLHVNKLLAKCPAKNTVRPHLHSCRLVQNCWYQHLLTDNAPLCHDPYSPQLNHRNSPLCQAETKTRLTGQVLYPHTQKLHTSTSETADTPGTSAVPLACAVTPSTKTTPSHLNRKFARLTNLRGMDNSSHSPSSLKIKQSGSSNQTRLSRK